MNVFERDLTRDLFVAVDRDARILFMSADEDVDTQALIGSQLWDLLPSKCTAGVHLRRCLEQHTTTTFVEERSGRYREARAYPNKHGGMSIFLRDITAERCAAAEREAWEAEQTRRAEFEQHLIGIVSHDMRNPLQVIRFAAVLGQKTANSEREQRHFQRILSSSDRALRMLEDLLDFTRIRFAGGLAIEAKHMDLHTLTAQVVNEVASTFPERQVGLAASGDGEGFWDPDRLGQVLQNLTVNALQHTTEGTQVSVRTCGQPEQVVLQVHNDGPPIPAQDLPAIFEPFQRGRGARSGGGRSLGLGLHITSHIVHAHGGRVRVESSAGHGTTFFVTLPRHPPEQVQEQR